MFLLQKEEWDDSKEDWASITYKFSRENITSWSIMSGTMWKTEYKHIWVIYINNLKTSKQFLLWGKISHEKLSDKVSNTVMKRVMKCYKKVVRRAHGWVVCPQKTNQAEMTKMIFSKEWHLKCQARDLNLN